MAPNSREENNAADIGSIIVKISKTPSATQWAKLSSMLIVMYTSGTGIFHILVRTLLIFYISLSLAVSAADEKVLRKLGGSRKGYVKGDLVPVSCLNRTFDTGEHITDSNGNLQYIPFPICNETDHPLAFPYGTPITITCTIASLEDQLYHLLEFFVHSDVPLTCRVPSYPLSRQVATLNTLEPSAMIDGNGVVGTRASEAWTPLTVALQGTLQLSHLHLHTSVNVLFHTSIDAMDTSPSHLIASTAYSLPNLTDPSLSSEGTKVLRTEPLAFTFNVGWVDGDSLPGMVGRPISGVKDHGVGFTLLSFFALAASAGLGAIGMMVWERRKGDRRINGLPPIGVRGIGMNGHSGYGGYGGYGGFGVGKRD